MLSAANTHDSTLFEPLPDTNPDRARPPRPGGPATMPTGRAARRQGLRLPPLPDPPRYQGPYRPARDRG
uniref:Uncharacterized protein n=1 Tax=Amycolatopsis orientalis subsp. vinearia TaxID=797057 RepID=A0A023GXG6_AMYOR|nr:hypothetical protein [Amycolatopsis orientalis subsp. vinearia]